MKISEHMTPDPITISSAVLLPEARKLLNEYQIRHLPVIDRDNKLIGIVTDRDLRSAYPSSVTSRSEKILAFEQVEKSTVEEMMTTTCSTLRPDSSIDEALVIFHRDKVGGIPVVNEDKVVVGIFSLLDLTAAFRKLFGVAEEGSFLVGIEDDGRDRILSEIIILLEEHNVAVTRLMKLTVKNKRGRIFMRISSEKPKEVWKLLRTAGFAIVEP